MIEIDLRVADERWESLAPLAALCTRICGVVEGEGQVDLLLTGDEEIQALNRDWRGKDKPTDVLSFPTPDGTLHDYLGDVAISYGVSAADAAMQGKTLEAHFCHLLIHGLLHLLGHDHKQDEEAELMEALERAALAKLGFRDPYLDSQIRDA